MPTGYTAGIIDGTIKDFPAFAKLCMRAFGATIHMRDENLEKEYEPRVPSDLYENKIKEINSEIEKFKNYSDEALSNEFFAETEIKIERLKERISETKKTNEKLSLFLSKTENWIPPTNEHQNFKDFMIDQLKQTLNFDGDDKYYVDKLNELSNSNFEVSRYRREKIDKLIKDLSYYENEQTKEKKRCDDANKWVSDVLLSLG